ncbi:MAG: hypothetical protein ACOYD7_00095 [Raoultibacter sp.]|jgi:hypothetical protein
MGDDKNDDKYKMRKNGWLALAVLLFLCTLSAVRYWILDFNFIAFLIGGVFLYFAYQCLKKSGVIDTDSKDDKWTGPKQVSLDDESQSLPPIRQASTSYSAPPVSMKIPDYQLSEAFPFENKAYVVHRYGSAGTQAEEPLAMREYYYADSKAILETVKDLASLEFLIDAVREKLPELPEMQTEVDRLTPVTTLMEESQLPVNSVCLTLKRSEDESEEPEYPLEVNFHACDDSLANGSFGTIAYSANGEIGRAAESFSFDGEHYIVRYGRVEGNLVIEQIVHKDDSAEGMTQIYSGE